MRTLITIALVTLVTPSRAEIVRTKATVIRTQVSRLTEAIMHLGIQPPNKNHITLPRAKRLAVLFEHYGKKWGVDPWLAVSIARQESHFRDKPKKVEVCKTVIKGDKAVKSCRSLWAGEQGMMQIVPRWSSGGFRACTGRKWSYGAEFRPSKINICAGMFLMRYRRDRVRRKVSQGKWFLMHRGPWSATKLFAPCGYRQRKFCRNGHSKACKRLWWVGSYNWGTHRVFCRRHRRGIDPASYPIKVIRRYTRIKAKYGKVKAVTQTKGPKT